jgi:hypothetical protein
MNFKKNLLDDMTNYLKLKMDIPIEWKFEPDFSENIQINWVE